jgi:hypothetical protein
MFSASGGVALAARMGDAVERVRGVDCVRRTVLLHASIFWPDGETTRAAK